jgi:hypothetical protein
MSFIEDKAGKCDKCGKYNGLIHLYVWLHPEDFYLCSKCQQDWSKIYGNHKEDLVTEFRNFMKHGATKGFVFR